MKKWVPAIAVLIAIQAAVLLWMGRPPICSCGTVKLWVSDVLSSELSQQLFDWYTFSHIVHGFLFYLVLWLLFRRISIWPRLLIAAGIEAGWEIAENSSWVIEAYRQQALAQGYVGDSVINSVFDNFSMITGFLLARRLPVLISIVLVLLLEAYPAYEIHDNLTLNVLNFIHPFDAITRWQSEIK